MINTSSIKLVPIQAMKCCIVSPFISDEEIIEQLNLFFENFKDSFTEDEIEQITQEILQEKRDRINDPQFIIELTNTYGNDTTTIFNIGNNKLQTLTQNCNLSKETIEAMYYYIHTSSVVSVYYKEIIPYLKSKFSDSELNQLKILIESLGISQRFINLYNLLNKVDPNTISQLKDLLNNLITINIPTIDRLKIQIISELKLNENKANLLDDMLNNYQVIYSDNFEAIIYKISNTLNLTPTQTSILYTIFIQNQLWVSFNTLYRIQRLFYNIPCSQYDIIDNQLKALLYTDDNVQFIKGLYLEKCNDENIKIQLQDITQSNQELVDAILQIIPTTTYTYLDIQKNSIFYKKVIFNIINKYIYKTNDYIINDIIYVTESKVLDDILNDENSYAEFILNIKSIVQNKIINFINTVVSNKDSVINKILEKCKEKINSEGVDTISNTLLDPTLDELQISESLDNLVENVTNTNSDFVYSDHFDEFNQKVQDLQEELKNGDITEEEFNKQYEELEKDLQVAINTQKQALDALIKLLNKILDNLSDYPQSETIVSTIKEKINSIKQALHEQIEKSPSTIENTDITVDQAIKSDQGLSVTKTTTLDDDELDKVLNSGLIDSNDPIYTIPVESNKYVVDDEDTLTIKIGDKILSAEVTPKTTVKDLQELFPDGVIVTNNQIIFSNKDSLEKPKISTANNTLAIPATPKLSIIKPKNEIKVSPTTSKIKQSSIKVDNLDNKLLTDDSVDKTTITVTINGITKEITVTKYDTVGSFIDKLAKEFPNDVSTIGDAVIFNTNSNNITIDTDSTDINMNIEPTDLPDKNITVDNAVNTSQTEVDLSQPLSSTNEPISGDVTLSIDGTDITIPIENAQTTNDLLTQVQNYLNENPQLGIQLNIDQENNTLTTTSNGNTNISIIPPDEADNVNPIDQTLEPVNTQVTSSNSNPILTTNPDNEINNPVTADQNIISDILNNYGDQDTEDPATLIQQIANEKPLVEVPVDDNVIYSTNEDSQDDITIPITDPVISVTPTSTNIPGINTDPNSIPTTNVTTSATLTAPTIPDTSFANIDVPGSSLPVVSTPSSSDILPAANSNADNIENTLQDVDDSNPSNISDNLSPSTASTKRSKESDLKRLRALIKLILGEYKKVRNYRKMALKIQANIKNGHYTNKGLKAATAYANHLSDAMEAWNRRKMNNMSNRLGKVGNGLLAFLQRIANSIGSFAQALARIAGAGRAIPICHPPSKDQLKALAQQAIRKAIGSKLSELDDFIAAIKRMIKTILGMIKSIIAMLTKIIKRMINTIKAIIRQTIISIIMALGQDACDLLVGLATIKGLIGKIVKLKSALSRLRV